MESEQYLVGKNVHISSESTSWEGKLIVFDRKGAVIKEDDKLVFVPRKRIQYMREEDE